MLVLNISCVHLVTGGMNKCILCKIECNPYKGLFEKTKTVTRNSDWPRTSHAISPAKQAQAGEPKCAPSAPKCIGVSYKHYFATGFMK